MKADMPHREFYPLCGMPAFFAICPESGRHAGKGPFPGLSGMFVRIEKSSENLSKFVKMQDRLLGRNTGKKIELERLHKKCRGRLHNQIRENYLLT